MGSLAMGFMGVLTFIVSWPLPQICYFFGYKATYFVAHVWGVVSFLGPLWPLLNQPVSAITYIVSQDEEPFFLSTNKMIGNVRLGCV
jgi:hypothetical protein